MRHTLDFHIPVFLCLITIMLSVCGSSGQLSRETIRERGSFFVVDTFHLDEPVIVRFFKKGGYIDFYTNYSIALNPDYS